MELATICLRLGLVFVFSFLFGLERQQSHKPVGFGTFTFVSLGACSLALTAVTLGITQYVALLSAIITGIGFLGAGAIIKSNDKLFGATTAAGIWLFAIIGLLIGIGEYLIGIIVYVAVWFVISIDSYLQHKGIGLYQKRLIITTNRIISEKEIRNQLLVGSHKHKLLSIDINKKDKRMTFVYVIAGSKDRINTITNQLYEQAWLDSYKVE